MNTSITSNQPLADAGRDRASGRIVAGVREQARLSTARRSSRTTMGVVEDGLLSMLVVFLFPLIVLLVGAPIALSVRAVIEIVQRFF